MKPALILDERAIRFGSLHVLRETVLARSSTESLPYWTHAVGIHAYWPVRVQLY
eukprot:COSAG01_NODE_54184_length_333_cov_18.119658_1_plen_53_part_01